MSCGAGLPIMLWQAWAGVLWVCIRAYMLRPCLQLCRVYSSSQP
jgi:hypothetical protein